MYQRFRVNSSNSTSIFDDLLDMLTDKKSYFSFLFVVVFLFTGGVFSTNSILDGLEEDFHLVKLEDELVAILEEEEEIKKIEDYIIELKEEKEKETGYELKLEEQISFEEVTESTLEAKYKNDLHNWDDIKGVDFTKRELKDKLNFLAKGYVMDIEGEHEIILESKKMANEVLDEVKSKYIAPYEGNEHIQIIGVALMEKVDTYSKQVPLTSIKKLDEAVEFLLNGKTNSKAQDGEEDEAIAAASKEEIKDQEIRSAYFKDSGEDLEDVEDLEPDEDLGHEDSSIINVRVLKEVQEKEAIPYETKEKDDSSLEVGETKVLESGEEGTKEVSYRILKDNDVEINKQKIEEKIIKDPKDKIVLKGIDIGTGTGDFIWPVNPSVGHVTSPYGPRGRGFHSGVDHAAPHGTTIRAADNGVVEYSGWRAQYGKLIIIDHSNGFKTYYAHNSSNYVSAGETVKKGQAIGEIGTTGNATGAHLHFELHKNGSHINPYNYVRP